jgi:hypothetical protein
VSTIAIDWSGAKNPNGKIWLAVCEHGQLLELSPADSRTEAIERLLDHLLEDSNAVGGLDFAFSMPTVSE